MLSRLMKRAEAEIDQEEAEERKSKIERRAARMGSDERIRAQIQGLNRSKNEGMEEVTEREQRNLVDTFGKVGRKIHPILVYHCLSFDGGRYHVLFRDRQRLLEARRVAVDSGLRVDDWGDHFVLTGRQVGERLRRVVGVDLSDKEITSLSP